MSRSACNSRPATDSHAARRHGPIITPLAVLAAALLGLFPATALAGSGELPSLIRDIGFCLVLAGVLAIAVLPALENPGPGPILLSFAGIGLLALAAVLFARHIIPIGFHWVAKRPEIILVAAVSWCFIVVLSGNIASCRSAVETAKPRIAPDPGKDYSRVGRGVLPPIMADTAQTIDRPPVA